MDTKFKFLLSNISPTTAGLLLILITVVLLLLVDRAVNDYFRGPGPWGIPILGFYPFLREDFHVHLTEMTKKYGDAYFISICGKRFLHLGSHKALKECYVKKADAFSGRSHEFSLFNYVFKNSLLFTDGEPWRELRKFVIKSMRELGLGARSQLKDPYIKSVQTVLKQLEDSAGKPVDLSELLSVQCSTVIRSMVFGDDVPDDVIQRINNAYLRSLIPAEGIGLLLVGNLSRYLIAPRIKGFNGVYKAKEELDILIAEILKDHKMKFDPNHPKDFIDHYLLAKKMKEDNNDPQAQHFNDKSFLPTMLQIYGDGGVGIGVVLAAVVKELSQREDVQNNMYDEIRREIGTERLPTYEDRIKLPYVNAVIKEVFRMTIVVTALSSLMCSKKTTVCGVFVPKGTITIINFHAIHNDATVYKNPERFDPTRFMPDNDTKTPREELPATFSIGKRSCLGEELVSTELFLFLTALMQRFSLRLVTDDKSKSGGSDESHQAMEIRVTASPR